MALGENSTYVRLEFVDVELGVPLQTPLYDGNRRVLLKRGESIETVHELEDLIFHGLYRNTSERPSHAARHDGCGALVGNPRTQCNRSIRAGERRAECSTSPARRHHDTGCDQVAHRRSLVHAEFPEAPRLVSKLIGHLKNKGLIVTVPESESELIMLRDGQSFIVRFFSGQNAYAFTTAVVKQTSVPYPHVHLSYPKEVRGREIRKGSRVDVELIAAIATEEGGAYTSSGKIVNLSISGGALRAKSRLGERDHVINVKFKILIGDMPSYVAVDCVIRAVSEDADPSGMPWLHGLQFLNPEPAMALALTAFVYQKIVGET
jgi:c-di-GMP-binding flagellar brake protein YcgR